MRSTMATFKVTFKESYLDHETQQTAIAPTRQDVIDWYGLEKDDIEYYSVEEIN